ncbi:hypothetical protein AB0L71_16030 [Streptomyces sp. NPDC052052]|uniref:hypothetical protein n=1 Tax=Streptomyces sp. NPDC052052 TaxID=3154756 RepID=UPI00342CA824
MGTTSRMAAAERIREAEGVHDELRDALVAVGVRLPSLGIDGASLAAQHPAPLITLGRCNVETARQLTDALKRNAA